jgi:Dolichyl-phosphate-mannose-protein mannosyltransferase
MTEIAGRPHDTVSLTRWVRPALLWATAMVAAKIYLASELELFGDEAFYRWESLNLAWSYSDLPPLTALSIWIGRHLGGESVLAVRSLFLVSGLALPLAVYFFARPVTDRNAAIASAGLSLLLPATASIGIMAVPDALLLTQCCLMMGALERACRTQRMRWWVITGLLGFVGFLIHYRFVFLPFPLGLAFLLFPALRKQLATPGPWVALLIALPGLAPAVWFNLSNDFEAVGFHFSRRHPWAFHSEGLAYPLQQAAAVSPLLYLFMLVALWHSCKQALAGDANHALLCSVSLFYIVGLSVLAPFVDQTSTTIHWAWFGYIPMLVALPPLLVQWRRSGAAGRLLTNTGLGLAGLFVAISIAMSFASLHFDALPKALQDKVSVKMVGWDRLRQEVANWYQPGERLYSSEYYVAAQLQQTPYRQSDVTVLEQEKMHRDGRAQQLYLWQASEHYFPQDGSSGLIVLDYETANRNEIYAQIDTLCRRFEHVESLSEFVWFSGRRHYALLRGHSARPPQQYNSQPVEGVCAAPLRGRVDSMREFREPRQGTVAYRGYLLAQPEGIAAVKVRIDGLEIAGRYGVSRRDVQRVLGAMISDPQYPMVGFEGEIETTAFSNGTYDVEFIGVTQWGREQVFKTLSLQIAN